MAVLAGQFATPGLIAAVVLNLGGAFTAVPARADPVQHRKAAIHDKSAGHDKPAAPKMRAGFSPDRTASIPPTPVPQANVGPSASAPPDPVIPPPYRLPDASRARMRHCGEIWRAKKVAGATGDDDWRDFALTCLVAEKP